MEIFLLLYLTTGLAASGTASVAASTEASRAASTPADGADWPPQGPREVRSLALTPFLQSMFK